MQSRHINFTLILKTGLFASLGSFLWFLGRSAWIATGFRSTPESKSLRALGLLEVVSSISHTLLLEFMFFCLLNLYDFGLEIGISVAEDYLVQIGMIWCFGLYCLISSLLGGSLLGISSCLLNHLPVIAFILQAVEFGSYFLLYTQLVLSSKGSMLLRMKLGGLRVVMFIKWTRHGWFHIWFDWLIRPNASIKK